MASRLEITVHHPDPEQGRLAAHAAFAEAERVERLLSPFLADSELSCVNRLAVSGPVATGPELIGLLEQADRIARLSGGAFNVAVQAGRPVDSDAVRIDRNHSTVEYSRHNIGIDPGAIGKGYAIDRAVERLRAQGITSALVSFGSTLYGLGRPPGWNGWRIAIRHPRDPRRTVGIVTLNNQALSTSGDYEQPGHLIDPRSGEPATGTVSASVTASTAAASDAWSTAAFVLGPAAGQALLEGQTGLSGLIIEERRPGRLTLRRTSDWPARASRPIVTRRQFLAGMAALVAWLVLPAPVSRAVVYATPEEALKRLLPEADAVREEQITLTDQQKLTVEQLLDSRIKENRYTMWRASRQGAPLGNAVQVDVIGKERPITFLVAVNPDGAILGIEVLIYRESQGDDIRSGRFMKQFAGKTLSAPIKLGRDIDAVSGATLSSRATTYAAKKALALVEVTSHHE